MCTLEQNPLVSSNKPYCLWFYSILVYIDLFAFSNILSNKNSLVMISRLFLEQLRNLLNPNLPGFDTSYFNPFVLWFLAETHCIWYVLPKYCNHITYLQFIFFFFFFFFL
uniref:Uncharacterized protein n=1 Tax=Anas platyrhynchos platyrhynchos TaxID=8840 RepID=A0A493TSG8_ANAPP